MNVDRRCFRYRVGESRLFNSPEEVPEGQGWVDSPAKVEAAPAIEIEIVPEAATPDEPAKKKRGRPRKEPVNGDSP